MADEPREDEGRETPTAPRITTTIPTSPQAPSFGRESEFDMEKGDWSHPTGVVEGADEGRVLVDDEDPSKGLNLGELETPEMPTDPTGIYVHRDTGLMIRMATSDESWVRYQNLDGSGRASITREEYERDFGKWWRRATPEDLEAFAETKP